YGSHATYNYHGYGSKYGQYGSSSSVHRGKKGYSIYRTATDQWCVDNCQLGYCPRSHCVCTDRSSDYPYRHTSSSYKPVYDDSKYYRKYRDHYQYPVSSSSIKAPFEQQKIDNQ